MTVDQPAGHPAPAPDATVLPSEPTEPSEPAGGHAAADSTASEASEAYDATVSETAKAFEEARGRLQSVASAGLEQGRGMVDQLMSGGEGFGSKFGPSLTQASQQMAAFNSKALEAWMANAQAAMSHWQSLVGVKSWSDMIALNAAHARRQIEVMTAQSRELAELAGRMVRDAGDITKRGGQG